jgi:hypothetical protein
MLGRAAVTIWCDVAPAAREEFERWHAREHMPERVSIRGFLRGSRWSAADGACFMLYEAQSEAVVASGPYLERLNDPTPWSRRMMPEHRNMVRSVCRVERAFGAGLGGALLTARFSAPSGAEEQLETWLGGDLLPSLPARGGFLSAQLLRSIAPPTGGQTTEQRIRGGDATADWIVLVGGADADALAALAAGELRAAAFARVYRLACLMNPGDVRAAR